MKMNTIDWIAFILVVVGALNWGLVGLFSFDLVQFLVGTWPIVAKIVYILVGVAAIYMIYNAVTKK